VHLVLVGRSAALAAWIGPPIGGGSTVEHPEAYDWLVRVLLLGREGQFRRRLLDIAAIEAGDAVLDVGCGTGTQLLLAAERVGPDGTLQGIEPSADLAAYARRRAAERGVALEVREVSAEALPYGDGTFDAVTCTLVLHRLSRPVQLAALAEMARVLRPEGRIVITDFAPPRSVVGARSLAALFHVAGGRLREDTLIDVATALRALGLEVSRERIGLGSAVASGALAPAAVA
jgi:ubiquinone/menaquinone biosynthesis C-methylase UbiE